MTKIYFVEAGSGDPSHRYENARLGAMLHRRAEEDFISVDPLRQPGFPQIGRGRLELDINERGIVLGARGFHGYRLTARDDPFDLGPLDMSQLGVHRAGILVVTAPHCDVANIVNALFDRSMEVGIYDADFPDQRYKVLRGPSAVTHDYILGALSIRKADGSVPVNLIARPQSADADRRFIFVDGQLITDTPIAFGLEFWREEIARDKLSSDTFHSTGAFRVVGGKSVALTEAQREFAQIVASELGLISGYVDVALNDGTPWLTGAHQSHVGDYTIYGADIGLIADATVEHLNRIKLAAEPGPHP